MVSAMSGGSLSTDAERKWRESLCVALSSIVEKRKGRKLKKDMREVRL